VECRSWHALVNISGIEVDALVCESIKEKTCEVVSDSKVIKRHEFRSAASFASFTSFAINFGELRRRRRTA